MVIERWKTVISICIFSTLFSIYLHLWWMRGICLTIFTYFCWWLSPLLSWPILVLLIGLLVHVVFFYFIFVACRFSWIFVFKGEENLILCKCVLHFLKKKSCLKLLQFSIEGCCIHDTATKKKRGDYLHYNNNLYCALDTKSVKTLKGNNCEKKREHSHSEIAKANRAEWLGHAKK